MRALPSVLLLCLAIFLVITYRSGHERPRERGTGVAQVGGPFSLTSTEKHPVRDVDFRGKPMVVYMGYSNCPDICPMTLDTMSNTLKALGPDADKVAMIFITLDPERDTPEVLGKYLTHFDKRIIGLTGSKQEIANVVQEYKGYYKKVATPNTGSYMVDHSGFIYLMDKQGKYVRHFDLTVKPDDLTKAVRELL